MTTEPLLRVDHLEVGFPSKAGVVQAVTDVSFEVRPGETLAVVGESGSGKSVTALTVMRLHPKSTRISGSIMFEGRDLLALDDDEVRAVRGNEIAMIFQDPMTALNPVFSVGSQIVESIRIHQKVSKQAAWNRAVELLALVGVPEPKRRAEQYPHEYSGGMRQRAMIAMAISNEPKLLIADEPTTALDVTVQAQVMDVLHDVQQATGSAMMLITHDLGLVAGSADRVQVMYASRLVETGGVDDIFYRSRNPYTRALLDSIPDLLATSARLEPIPGNPPSLLNPPSGCPFRPRCLMAIEHCAESVPELVSIGEGHASRCHRTADIEPTAEATS
ncbi:MAG: ABC transporter ATP-binding protein [Actinomycetota bacterium]|nr:ABC transporter ATP-binding protein [Actinomycetota bacterium]MDA3015667.1 ABC transporter ATP-binding protein [Actinomycetota bacterium]MDA3027443.1 ABC transporter ATP-binding protein [Actinomycetota bacterium]